MVWWPLRIPTLSSEPAPEEADERTALAPLYLIRGWVWLLTYLPTPRHVKDLNILKFHSFLSWQTNCLQLHPNLRSPMNVFLDRRNHVRKRNLLKASAQQGRMTTLSFSPSRLWCVGYPDYCSHALGKNYRGEVSLPPQGSPARSSDISYPHHPGALASSWCWKMFKSECYLHYFNVQLI